MFKSQFIYKKVLFGALMLTVVVGSFFVGVHAGYEAKPELEKVVGLSGKEAAKPVDVDFEAFWKVWNTINEKYVSHDGPENQEKVYGAIRGLTASLGDPYTVFFPPEENKMFESDISGEFQGVGMEIGVREGALTVIAPLKDTPAERAGLRSGDMIIKIDETNSADLTVDEAVRLIRGPKGKAVSLTVLRKEHTAPLEISVVRDVIKIPTARTTAFESDGSKVAEGAEQQSGEVFVISLYNFSAQSADVFRQSLQEFVNSGKTKLILDLRGNPGGYLEAAVDMASWFLPKGKVVVRESFAEDEEETVYRSKGYNIFNDNLRMVILVDGGSASASEILAGALSEHGVATLIGAKTFGKGSVQELVKITDETSLKITVARWLTPNGSSISEKGIEPDIAVERTEADREKGRDTQMDEAVKFLSNG